METDECFPVKLRSQEKCSKGDRIEFDTEYLLNFFMNSTGSFLKISPSAYKRELTMTSEERNNVLARTVKDRFIHPQFSIPTDYAVTPPVMIFQNWQAGQKYSLQFTLTNKSKHPVELCATWNFNSKIFNVIITDSFNLRRLAPLQPMIFTVVFTPNVNEDEQFVVSFMEKKQLVTFRVPVLAICPRPLIDCPDFVTFPTTVVNVPSVAQFPLVNIGTVPVAASLKGDENLIITPNKIKLDPSESILIHLNFKLDRVERGSGEMEIYYENGEIITVTTHYSVLTGDVTILESKLSFERTYVQLRTFQEVIIRNRSDFVLNFCWKTRRTKIDDEIAFKNMMKTLDDLYEPVNLVTTLQDTSPGLANRIKEDEIKFTGPQEFAFSHPCFEIIPLKGTVQRDSTFKCMVSFLTQKTDPYNTSAYLEIDGLAERLELKITGEALGPAIEIISPVINLEHVVCSCPIAIEISFINYGPIPGCVQFINESEPSVTSVKPDEIQVQPNDAQPICLELTILKSGPFFTEVKFVVVESSKIICCLIRANVEVPAVGFIDRQVDFSSVAIGFVYEKEVILENKSDRKFSFEISVPTDGTESPVTVTDFQNALPDERKPLPKNPREYKISPNSGTLSPHSITTITLTLIPNRFYQRSVLLQLAIECILLDEKAIQVVYYCHHPMVNCVPVELNLKHLVLRTPVSVELVLTNETETPIAFAPTLYSSGIVARFESKWIVLDGKETTILQVTLIPIVLGEGNAIFGLEIFGRYTLEEICLVFYQCQPPYLVVNPIEIKWKHLTDLDSVRRTVVISNPFKSPLQFVAVVNENADNWELEYKGEIILLPEMSLEMGIEPKVIDFGRTDNELTVVTAGIKGRTAVKLTVDSNVSNAIRTEPNIMPEWDFGTVLKGHKYSKTVSFKNIGTKSYRVYITPNPKSSKKVVKNTFFAFNPYILYLNGGGGNEHVTIELDATKRKVINELFYVYALLMTNNKKQLVCTITLKSKCILPHKGIVLNPERVAFSMHEFYNSRSIMGVDDSYEKTVVATVRTSYIDYVMCEVNAAHFYITNETSQYVKKMCLNFNAENAEVSKEITLVFMPPVILAHDTTRFNGQLIVTEPKFSIKKIATLEARIIVARLAYNKKKIEMGCVLPHGDSHDELVVTNYCPFPLAFHWVWEKIDIIKISSKRSVTISHQSESHSKTVPVNEATPENLKPEVQAETKPSPSPEELVCDVLVPFVANHLDSQLESDLFKQNPICTGVPDECNSIVSISPTYGKLEPGASVSLNVFFHPNEPLNVRGWAFCLKQDNYKEMIEFVGFCREKVDCSVTPKVIDFGIIPLCDLAENYFTIENNTHCPITYEIRNTDLTPVYLYERIVHIELEPMSGVIPAMSTTNVVVKVFPGVFGHFEKSYYVELCDSEVETVYIKGTGAMRQLLIGAPREDNTNLPIAVQYNALRELGMSLYGFSDVSRRKINTSDICLLNPGDLFDWDLLENETWPSVNEIELSEDRALAQLAAEIYADEFKAHAFDSMEMKTSLPYLLAPGHVIGSYAVCNFCT